MEKAIIKFGAIKMQKQKLHQDKGPILNILNMLK